MSLFPRFPTSDFAPIFRLLDDYDVHRAARETSSLRAFQPKFDVREVKDAYELHGELPGIEQKDVSIEFTDPTTLVIKGRTERSFTRGTPPAAIEGGQQPVGRITGEVNHKATVEDEAAEESQKQVQTKPEEQQPEEESKYWVSERSVGEFHRSFSFPTRVDQDAVKASLKNGILSITVPKAKKQASSRRINIE